MAKRNLFILMLMLALKGISQELSLPQAIGIALQNNYDVQISTKQQEIIDLNNSWYEAGILPSISLQAVNNNVIIDNTNNPFTFTPGVLSNQGITPSFSMDWNIFTGLAIRINKKRFEQLAQQSKGNITVVLESLVSDVTKAYYAAKLQEERKKLFQNILASSRERRDLMAIKEKYAKANSLELLQFNNTYLNDSINLILQESSYANAIKNLLIVMNDQEKKWEEVTLTTTLYSELDVLDHAKLKEELKKNNSNLKTQQIGIQLQQSATELQKSFLLPTLSLQLGASPNWGWFRQLDVANGMSAETQSVQYFANLNLRYTLFNNFKTKRAIQTSKIQEEIEALTYDKMYHNILQQLNVLLDDYSVRQHLVSISEKNVEYANKARKMANDRFNLGLINSVDLSVFENNFLTAQFQHQENLYNRIVAYNEILKISGKFSLSTTEN